MQLLTVSQRETGDTNELSSDQRRLLRTPAAPWGAIQFNLIFTIHFAPTKIKFLNLYSKSLLIYNSDDFFVNNSQISKLISILPQVCILIALKIIREPFVQLNVISSQKQFRNLFVFFCCCPKHSNEQSRYPHQSNRTVLTEDKTKFTLNIHTYTQLRQWICILVFRQVLSIL